MKLSELIETLQYIKDNQGDLDTVTNDLNPVTSASLANWNAEKFELTSEYVVIS